MPVFESKSKQAAGSSFSLILYFFCPGARKPPELRDPQAALLFSLRLLLTNKYFQVRP